MLNLVDLARGKVLNLLNQSLRRNAHLESSLVDIGCYQNTQQPMKCTMIISWANHEQLLWFRSNDLLDLVANFFDQAVFVRFYIQTQERFRVRRPNVEAPIRRLKRISVSEIFRAFFAELALD